MSKIIFFLLLLTSVFFSAVEVVIHRHGNRQLFLTLQELQSQRSDLDQEWGQLLLEQGTWGAHGRIEDVARNKLDMTLPNVQNTFRVRS
jgi:cell division protein FtsL